MITCISKLILVIVDIIIVNGAFFLSLLLRFDGVIEAKYLELYKENFILITLVMLVIFFLFNLYKNLWRYASVSEMLQIVGSSVVGSATLLVVGYLQKSLFPRSSYIIYMFVLTIFMIASRFAYRLFAGLGKYSEWIANILDHRADNIKKRRVMIVGAGEAASIIIKDFKRDQYNRKIILVVDDDKKKINANLHGIPIKGDTNMIPGFAKYYKIDEIIIAIPSASKKRIAEVAQIASKTSASLRIFHGIEKSIERGSRNRIRPVRIEDLLGREEINIDNHKLDKKLNGKTIMVTGGGGSIGSELCRQVLKFKPAKLVILDIYENNAYDLQNELMRKGIPDDKIDVIIGSVRDKARMHYIFDKYRPNVVFHAAAHKHVPLMEFNPEEAIKNNVIGTLNTAQLALEFEVDKFIMVSTDKAVNPTNVMGASKRLCEMIIQSINKVSDHTDFVAVRFGNVLGSNGSVIPLFKKQLEAGGPITVTHPEIIRYFMTIPEAVRLILEASTFASGGEIFVLDMGEPVKIADLAKNLIRLSGLKEGRDIQIKYIGLRPGEKLYEELLMEEEGLKKTCSSKIFVAKPGDIEYEDLLEDIIALEKGIDDGKDIRLMLKEIVPTYILPEDNIQEDIV